MAPGPVGLTFGVGFLLVGAYMFGRGGLELPGVLRAVRGAPTPVAALPDDAGPVRVEGLARKASASVKSPFSETRCLAYEYEALERTSPTDDWTTLGEGRKAVPFCVEDDTGRVRVEPTDALFALPEETRDVEPGTAPPDRVGSYFTGTERVSAADRTVDVSVTEADPAARQRFVERRLAFDVPVTVSGESVPTRLDRDDEALVDAVLRGGEATPLSVVAVDRPGPPIHRLARGPLLRVAGGGALLAVAAVLLEVLPAPA